ncbi:hypothetical protein L1887_40788 [Cichorium endivia]|nr:hypothetical protein L1887_40788 [Cichorium endivia]
MHLIDLSDTNSSSDKAAKETQPQSVNSLLKDDSLHQKVDALTTLLTDLKSSQNQEALINELTGIKDRVAALEKKDKDILLHCDTHAERIINDGLATLDTQRETDAANMMKTTQQMLTDVEKCQLQVPELLANVELKLKEATDHMAKYLNVMDALQTMYDTPLPECIKKEVTIVSGKLDTILDRLPVTPSVPTRVPGGGKANDQPTAMIIDSAAGPSGTKDQGNIQQKETVDAATDSGTNEDNNQNKESEIMISPTPKSPNPISPPPINPPQKSPPPISPPPTNPSPIPSPQKPPHQQSPHSEDEIFVYSPIKDSDPPEIQERKSKFFDDQANEHAKDFSTESKPDQHQNDQTGPSKSIYSNNNYRLMTDSD